MIASRATETTTTTGTGTVNLAGADTGQVTLVSAIGTGNPCFYVIAGGTEWEEGVGTVTAGSPDTLSRTHVIRSSNSNALVSFSAGSKSVFVTAPGSILDAAIKRPSLAPNSPDGDNEEFDAMPASPWVQDVTPDATYEELIRPDSWFGVRNKGSGTGTNSTEYYKPLTRAGAFTATIRCSQAFSASNYSHVMIHFRAGHASGDKIFVFGMEFSGSSSVVCQEYNGSSWNYSVASFADTAILGEVWVHVERDASNNWSAWMSRDGITWRKFMSGHSFTLTIAEVAVSVNCSSSQSGATQTAAIDFLRFDWLTM